MASREQAPAVTKQSWGPHLQLAWTRKCCGTVPSRTMDAAAKKAGSPKVRSVLSASIVQRSPPWTLNAPALTWLVDAVVRSKVSIAKAESTNDSAEDCDRATTSH